MRGYPIFILFALFAVCETFSLTPDDLMCELLTKPGLVAITDEKPEFSWLFKEGLPGDYQTAYQLQVATSTECFKQDAPDLWDSTQIPSNESLFVPYDGKPLPTAATVVWRVRVWDKKQRVGPWSQNMAFTTSEHLGEDTPLRFSLTQRQVEPTRITSNEQGRVFVDFGRAAFGWAELLPPRDLERGGAFKLHLGEKAQGRHVDPKPGASIRYAQVRGALTNPGIYRVPLEADPRNTTGGKEGVAIQMPKEFGVVMPFRYVEIEECPYSVTADTIRQIAINYPFDDDAARFVSSDDTLNRVFDFCKYSTKATTFAGVYVDGDRERIPYEADAYIAQLCHYAMDREFTLARYTHEYLMTHPTWPTEWKQHSVMMAWADWMYTGNTESLARTYETLKAKKTLENFARAQDGLLVTAGATVPPQSDLRDIVDWPEGERDGFEFRPVNAVVNAFYCLNLQQMAEMARALDKTTDAEAYRQKAARAREAFHACFFNAERGCYLDGEGATHASLHANMFPLAFGLVPQSEQARVANFIKWRGMACSPYGAQYLLEALFQAGEDDAAFHLMTRSDRRSWVNMLNAGSTITMEAWDQMYKQNLGWNHAWGAAPANIIPRFVMGVKPLTPGFGKILIRPQVGTLEAIQGYMPTIHGRITVGVRQKPGHDYRLTFEIPINTIARVEVPWQANAELRVDGKLLSDVTLEKGRLVLDDLTSGKHTVQWQVQKEQTCESHSGSGVMRILKTGWRNWLPSF